MDWLAVFVGLVTGTLIGVIGSAAAVYFSRVAESRKDLGERRHRIYMMLLDVYNRHFWISTNDMHNTEIKRELKEDFQAARWKIADELRGADKLPQLGDIFDALFSLRFKTEVERAERLRKVIDDLARDVNPNFVAAAKKNEAELSALIMRDGDEWWRRRHKIEPW